MISLDVQIKKAFNKLFNGELDNYKKVVKMKPPAKNNRTILQEEYLRVMDDTMHMGVIERLCYAAVTCVTTGDIIIATVLEQLMRPECQNQMAGKDVMFGLYMEVVKDPDSLSAWMAFQAEAGKQTADLMARKLALYSVLSDDWLGETAVELSTKIFNAKKRFMEGAL